MTKEQQAMETWLRSLYKRGDYTHCINITFDERYYKKFYNKQFKEEDAKKIGEDFKKALNKLAFKHRYIRENKELGIIFATERGKVGDKLHLHFVVGNLPKHCKSKKWLKRALFEIRTKYLKTIGRSDIMTLYSDGFNGYITKDDSKSGYTALNF